MVTDQDARSLCWWHIRSRLAPWGAKVVSGADVVQEWGHNGRQHASFSDAHIHRRREESIASSIGTAITFLDLSSFFAASEGSMVTPEPNRAKARSASTEFVSSAIAMRDQVRETWHSDELLDPKRSVRHGDGILRDLPKAYRLSFCQRMTSYTDQMKRIGNAKRDLDPGRSAKIETRCRCRRLHRAPTCIALWVSAVCTLEGNVRGNSLRMKRWRPTKDPMAIIPWTSKFWTLCPRRIPLSASISSCVLSPSARTPCDIASRPAPPR